MSRSYWERWNWELQRRKEVQAAPAADIFKSTMTTQEAVQLHEIEPSMLKDPQDLSNINMWAGRGSFSVVKIQLYRGLKVVSKELLPKTLLEDLKHEAAILAKLSHPYLPYLFGICTKSKPFKLVMQFHGMGSTTYTFSKSLGPDGLDLSGEVWLSLCAQLTEALKYLHNEACVLHNGIKGNNVLIGQSISTQADPQGYARVQIVLIDFGMATMMSESKRLRLTENEMVDHRIRYPHIAPEVVTGEHKLSPASDIFSFGSLLYKCVDYGCFNKRTDIKKLINSVADKCHHLDFRKRPSARGIIDEMQAFPLSIQ